MYKSEQKNKSEEKKTTQRKGVALQKKNNTGLPDNLKSGIENLSGHSMDDVKVHYNSSKPATLQAHAYAQGNEIHLAPNQEKHLPHEAWHVVQQKQGRVQPTTKMGDVNINDDAKLEKEADVMGAKAVQMKAVYDDGSQDLKQKSKKNRIVQKIQLVNDVLVSSFDPKKLVNSTQAVISVHSNDGMGGGHSTLFLEYVNAEDEGVAEMIDLRVDENGPYLNRRILQTEYKPSNALTSTLFSRSISGSLNVSGNYESYVIKPNGVQKAMVKATELAKKMKSGEITYGFTLNLLSNLNPFASTTKMNCADFAAEVLQAAGVNISSGLLSMPSGLTRKDTRTNDEIYDDAREE